MSGLSPRNKKFKSNALLGVGGGRRGEGRRELNLHDPKREKEGLLESTVYFLPFCVPTTYIHYVQRDVPEEEASAADAMRIIQGPKIVERYYIVERTVGPLVLHTELLLRT